MFRRICYAVISLVCCVFLTTVTGCYAYKFKGQVSNPQPVISPASIKYRLNTVSFDKKSGCKCRSNPAFSVAKTGGPLASKDDIERVLVRQYPDLFTKSSVGVPVDVEIKITESKDAVGTWGSLVSGAATALALIPPYIGGVKDVCEIRVGIANNDNNQSNKEIVGFASRAQVSLTPLGFLLSDPQKTYVGATRYGSGVKLIWCDGDMRKAQQEVFTEEVAKAVALAVTRRKIN